ncbi:HEAT repeat domain-containing protein [Streptomyces sp. NPDC046887]|uniref:HEAT repeat domain-containing protein n=1 Tax=Streptomyces sp. NPDC046887 TaxID=3155472 RepID=UPI0034106CC6
MTMVDKDDQTARTLRGLAHEDTSVRLRAALAVGTAPAPEAVGALIERCAIEPDFSVREMLTWALTRHPAALTLPPLLTEVRSNCAQARSQALHTLSKIGDPRAWPAITPDLLADPDDEVARSAWRAAIVLVPEDEKHRLATSLTSQLGRGRHETRLSLSRALIALGEVVLPVLSGAAADPDPEIRSHALATERLWHDPDAGFASAIEEAKRMVALGGADREGR